MAVSTTDFSATLKEARLAAGLTHGQLAERLGVAIRTIESWEGGPKIPWIQHLQKLHDLLPDKKLQAVISELKKHKEAIEPRKDKPRLKRSRFALAIRRARLKAGLTQPELAKRCGMSENIIRLYETGKVPLSYRTLQQINNALQSPELARLMDAMMREETRRCRNPICAAVKQARIEAGLRKVDVAQQLGVTQGQVWNWDNCAIPIPARLRELGRLFNSQKLLALADSEEERREQETLKKPRPKRYTIPS